MLKRVTTKFAQEYLDKMSQPQVHTLSHIEEGYHIEVNLQDIFLCIERVHICQNKEDSELVLKSLLQISENHHRTQNFIRKITQIIEYFLPQFTTNEIMDIFKDSKLLMLFLFQKNIVSPEKFAAKYQDSLTEDFCRFFNQELKSVCNNQTIEIENFQEKREIGENDEYICYLIRNDSVKEFVQYVNRANIQLKKNRIKKSIFETNSFLMNKTPTLIEYAAFFGSIQIFDFLKFSDVDLTPSLWIYAIHSNNPELIHKLEEYGVYPEDKTYKECFAEAIKCHHNQIANYIYDNKFSNSDDDLLINLSLKYYNLELIPTDLFEKLSHSNLYSLIFYDYSTLVDFLVNEKILNCSTKLSDNSQLARNDYISPLSLALSKNNKKLFDNLLSNVGNEIEPFMFKGCESLRSLTIPDTVTKILDSSFDHFDLLLQVKLPNALKFIGSEAFNSCESLRNLVIPPTVQRIGNGAFKNCLSLKQISLPAGINYIGSSAFKGCASLIEIKIPDLVRSIENNTFENCESLQKIDIHPFIVEIGDSSFKGCRSLTKVTFGDDLEKIGNKAFSGCFSLVEVSFLNFNESKLNSIGEDAFRICSSLQRFNIPLNVTIIKANTFQYCNNLKQVTIPAYLNQIEKNAFEGCSSLTKIKIPSTVTAIGSYAFSECKSLESVDISSLPLTKIEVGLFNECTLLKEIKIPPTITWIQSGAFSYCVSLEKINIPNLVTQIEHCAFEFCTSLANINIPSSVTQITDGTFYYCTSLVFVYIPNSVISIGKYAFAQCTSVTNVVIPNSVVEIGDSAFGDCISLCYIFIPNSVRKISNCAFIRCPNMIHNINIPPNAQYKSSFINELEEINDSIEFEY